MQAVELKQEKESRNKGMIGTIAVHGLLLLFLVLLKLMAPVPPPEEEGILINFGTSDQGSGNVEPVQPSETKSKTESNALKTEQPPEQTKPSKPQPMLTQDVEDAPKITKEKPKPKEDKPKTKPVEQPVKPEQPKVDPNALYPGKKTKINSGSSGSEGETGKPGNQGSLEGDPNAPSHVGGGKGDKGIQFDLAGRGWRVKPSIDDRSQETGTVVMAITVDKYGNVTQASGPARGSTTSSTVLVSKSKEAALRAKFSPCTRDDCAEEQRGTITFKFILE